MFLFYELRNVVESKYSLPSDFTYKLEEEAKTEDDHLLNCAQGFK